MKTTPIEVAIYNGELIECESCGKQHKADGTDRCKECGRTIWRCYDCSGEANLLCIACKQAKELAV